MPAGAWIEIILYCRTPALHKAIAEVLIEKGRWQLADSEEQVSAGAPGTHSCRDNLRGSSNVTTIIDVKVYNTIGN